MKITRKLEKGMAQRGVDKSIDTSSVFVSEAGNSCNPFS